MNNLNGYYGFLNEELFRKKTFDDYIDIIDQLFLEFENCRVGIINEARPALRKTRKILRIMNDIVLKNGKHLTQEEIDKLTIRYNQISKNTGMYIYGLNLTELHEIANLSTSFLNMIGNLITLHGFNVKDIEEERFNNPIIVYKQEGRYHVVHKSYVEKRKKELKEKTKGIDPYGEEDWES